MKMVLDRAKYQFALDIFEDAVKCDEKNFLLHAVELYADGIRVMQDIIPVPKDLKGKNDYYTMLHYYASRKKRICKAISRILQSSQLIQTIEIPDKSIGFGYDLMYGPYLTASPLTQAIIEEPLMRTIEHFDNLVTFIATLMKHGPYLEFVLINTIRSKPHKEQLRQKTMIRTILRQFEAQKLALKFKFENQHNYRRIILNNGHIFECDKGLHIYSDDPMPHALGKSNLALRHCTQTCAKIYRCPRLVRTLDMEC